MGIFPIMEVFLSFVHFNYGRLVKTPRSTTCTYTFHLREGVKWHDGVPLTAQDVEFTIEAIMDPENGSENAPNFEDVVDGRTISFRLAAPNVAFLDYMSMAVLPRHLLEGEDMQESDFFRKPVGTGPYKLESWDEGQAITLVKNEDYYRGAPNIDRIIFKIVPDDSATLSYESARYKDYNLLMLLCILTGAVVMLGGGLARALGRRTDPRLGAKGVGG